MHPDLCPDYSVIVYLLRIKIKSLRLLCELLIIGNVHILFTNGSILFPTFTIRQWLLPQYCGTKRPIGYFHQTIMSMLQQRCFCENKMFLYVHVIESRYIALCRLAVPYWEKWYFTQLIFWWICHVWHCISFLFVFHILYAYLRLCPRRLPIFATLSLVTSSNGIILQFSQYLSLFYFSENSKKWTIWKFR